MHVVTVEEQDFRGAKEWEGRIRQGIGKKEDEVGPYASQQVDCWPGGRTFSCIN